MRILQTAAAKCVYADGMASADDQRPPRGLRRLALLVTGSIALGLGVLGAILPLLPATPFVLLAAACFAGAWPAMHRRLAESRLFGPMVRAGPGGRFLPRRTKAVAIAFTLVSIGTTVLLVAEAAWLRWTLAGIALGVTLFLLWMPSAPRACE